MPVTLPARHWGDPASSKRALMVHGLGSSALSCWQVMEALAFDGWCATAVDLRGHGSAPRTHTYRIADFASDLAATVPPSTTLGWDVVIGHSIGAASAVVASAVYPEWAKRLVLLDPALRLDDALRHQVLANQRQGHLHDGVEEITAAHPHWHPQDISLKVDAHRAATLWALERAVQDNDPWDVTEHAHALRIPTLALGGEAPLGSMFHGDEVRALQGANPLVDYQQIHGAGHSIHRDKPTETIAAIRLFVADV